jgi:ABC-2 type transport system ATP-binding protein
MIQVENLTKYFGQVLAVDNISFQVSRGEIVGFLGLNGAGKTTTMRILTTFLPATSGIAKVAGYDVMNQSMEVRQNIGYLPESVPLYPEMRVEEYLDYRAKLKGVERTQRRQRIENALERCRIREVRRRLLGTLSKGYRQRVGLADALSHDPPIIIMDEPTSGLDPVQIRETLNAIKDLSERHTILFSTHILPEVETICSRVIIIHRGSIGVDRKMADMVHEDEGGALAEVRGPHDQVKAAFQSLEGVKSVKDKKIEADVYAYDIRALGKRDLREAIFQRVVKGNWVLRRLETPKHQLEEYFMELTMRSDGLEQ